MPSGTQVDKLIMDSLYTAIQSYVFTLGYDVNMANFAPGGPNEGDIDAYNSQSQAIKDSKGFQVLTFSQSSARYKGGEFAPRIVLFQSRTLPGDIGAPVHVISTQDKNNAELYQEGFLVPQAMNMIIAIHLISANSTQHYLLNQIIAWVIGQRRYIPYNDTSGEKFFIFQSSFSDLDDPFENIIEKGYFYTVPDVYLGEMDVQRSAVHPINTIDVSIQTPDDPDFDQLEVTDEVP